MSSVRKMILIGVFSGAVLGCGDNGTGPELADIVGTWHATRAQVTGVANPANTIDLVAAGATLQVVFNASHTFASTITFPGDPAENSTGTYTQTATTLTLTNSPSSGGEVTVFNLALNGATLLLTGGSPFTFDFGAGEVASKLDLTLVH